MRRHPPGWLLAAVLVVHAGWLSLAAVRPAEPAWRDLPPSSIVLLPPRAAAPWRDARRHANANANANANAHAAPRAPSRPDQEALRQSAIAALASDLPASNADVPRDQLDNLPAKERPVASLLGSAEIAEDDGSQAPQRVELPPPAALRYQARRGAMTGEARLDWQPDEHGYRLHLQVALPGRPSLDWVSQGQIGPTGTEPARMVERRKGRDATAVNFRRDQGVISFSGPAGLQPLVDGSQDRASWLAQLAGAAQARGAAWRRGDRVAFQVAGPRGELDLWRFELAGTENLRLAGRNLDTLHLVRDPVRPFDWRIEAWLATGHHHLPVQLRFGVVPGQERLELQLLDGLP